MPRSVRTRITLLATSVTLGICIVVCTALYIGLFLSLHREVDAFLDGEVREFQAILEHEEDDELKEIEREIRNELGGRPGGDLTFRLLDAQGRLLITSDPTDSFPNPWVPAQPLSATDAEHQTHSGNGLLPSLRFCSRRVTLRRHGDVIVQATYRLDRVDRSLSVCRWVCFTAVLLAAILSFLGGHMVARNSMRPVAAMTQSARSITAKQLSLRVPRSGTNDEIDELANTLNNMLERIEAGVQRIQQFTADAAHELRTPLTALRGNAEFALSQPRSVEQLKGVIEQSLDYYRILSRVTDDLLLLARLDAGQEPLQAEPCSLSLMVDEVVDLYRPLAADHGIEIRVHSPDVVTASIDAGKIRRVISNLLDNAIKYMGGPGSVTIGLSGMNGTATIHIDDTGSGIPPDDLPHIFERFYRVDRARSVTPGSDTRSIGLGLAICRSILHAHGGELNIQSTQGKGTKVEVVLPRLPDSPR
ncbi:MAG: heavy metal sensor histidine kinase [Planctomycetota bacterium]